MSSKFIDTLLSLAFPHECRVCGKNVRSFALGAACAECWADTRIFSGNEALCPKCGRFLRDGRIEFAGRCHRCDDYLFDEAVACGIYEKALAATVIELKKKPHLPAFVRDVMSCRFENMSLHDFDALVPVPVSPRRLLERGFNQAEVVAAAVASEFRMEVASGILTRPVHTRMHRGGMDAKARDATVRKAFKVSEDCDIEGKRLVLVDDVMTSGSTASHCAGALKRRGAGAVKVFTIARAK